MTYFVCVEFLFAFHKRNIYLSWELETVSFYEHTHTQIQTYRIQGKQYLLESGFIKQDVSSVHYYSCLLPPEVQVELFVCSVMKYACRFHHSYMAVERYPNHLRRCWSLGELEAYYFPKTMPRKQNNCG